MLSVPYFTCASLQSRRPVERNVQGTNRPGNETSQERNVHCVRATKRLGNEKSINPRKDRPPYVIVQQMLGVVVPGTTANTQQALDYVKMCSDHAMA